MTATPSRKCRPRPSHGNAVRAAVSLAFTIDTGKHSLTMRLHCGPGRHARCQPRMTRRMNYKYLFLFIIFRIFRCGELYVAMRFKSLPFLCKSWILTEKIDFYLFKTIGCNFCCIAASSTGRLRLPFLIQWVKQSPKSCMLGCGAWLEHLELASFFE